MRLTKLRDLRGAEHPKERISIFRLQRYTIFLFLQIFPKEKLFFAAFPLFLRLCENPKQAG
jgi:hypothetical protein